MIIQYPDTIVISINEPGSTDSDGNWVAGNKVEYTFNCRAETNTSGRRIIGVDGVFIDYTIICYAPIYGFADVLMTTDSGDVLTTEDGEPIVIGELISSLQYAMESSYVLTNRLGMTLSGTVKHSSIGQLNTRIWL